MAKKWAIHNQTTGLQEERDSFEAIKTRRLEIMEESGLFNITVLVQNADSTWTQSLADANGDPVPSPEPL
jgi:hypothetical protein